MSNNEIRKKKKKKGSVSIISYNSIILIDTKTRTLSLKKYYIIPLHPYFESKQNEYFKYLLYIYIYVLIEFINLVIFLVFFLSLSFFLVFSFIFFFFFVIFFRYSRTNRTTIKYEKTLCIYIKHYALRTYNYFEDF